MIFSLFKKKEAVKVKRNIKIERKIISNEISMLNLIIFFKNLDGKYMMKKIIKKERRLAFLRKSSNRHNNETKENANNGKTKKKFRITRPDTKEERGNLVKND